MAEHSEAGALFAEHFLEKNLVEFSECSAHYGAMTVNELVAELDFLFRPDVMAIPFGFTGRRYYAFLNAVVNAAANTRELADIQRAKLVSLALMLHENARLRTVEGSRTAFDAAWTETLTRVHTFGLFPLVADLLEQRRPDYDGKFPIGAVGEVLERQRSTSRVCKFEAD